MICFGNWRLPVLEEEAHEDGGVRKTLTTARPRIVPDIITTAVVMMKRKHRLSVVLLLLLVVVMVRAVDMTALPVLAAAA